jgi:hypothetical protein
LFEGEILEPFSVLDDPLIGGSTLLSGLRTIGPLEPDGSPISSIVGAQAVRLERTTETTVWECGTFRYYVPDIGSDQWRQRAISALYGADLTPSLAWELMPWSWLIDWFSSVGSIVSNLSTNAVDNEALTNSYAMKTVEVRDDVIVRTSWEGLDYQATSVDHNNDQTISDDEFHDWYLSVPPGSDTLSYSLIKVNKLRAYATPFGFGFDMSALSLRQLAILAALAISR